LDRNDEPRSAQHGSSQPRYTCRGCEDDEPTRARRRLLQLRHAGSADEVVRRVLESMNRIHPELFSGSLTQKAFRKGLGEEIQWYRSPVTIVVLRAGTSRASSSNGIEDVS